MKRRYGRHLIIQQKKILDQFIRDNFNNIRRRFNLYDYPKLLQKLEDIHIYENLDSDIARYVDDKVSDMTRVGLRDPGILDYELKNEDIEKFGTEDEKKFLKETAQLNEKWKDKLQNVYTDLEEFIAYDEIYNLSGKLGFTSPEEAWNANPIISGSANPEEYGRVKENADDWYAKDKIEKLNRKRIQLLHSYPLTKEKEAEIKQIYSDMAELKARLKESTSIDKHRAKIARKTLKMPDEIANVMGSPSKEEAAEYLKSLKKKKSNKPDFAATVNKDAIKNMSKKNIDKIAKMFEAKQVTEDKVTERFVDQSEHEEFERMMRSPKKAFAVLYLYQDCRTDDEFRRRAANRGYTPKQIAKFLSLQESVQLEEAKNEKAKTRKVDDPYEVYAPKFGPLQDWTWHVLKHYQSPEKEKTNPYARVFCAVKSPMTYGDWEYGDVYCQEIIGYHYE